MNKYKDHPESHFKVGVQCAWQKANEYYCKLDNSPVYLAAIALHPGFKWQYIENRWSTRMDWVNAGLKKVKDLWQDQYKPLPLDDVSGPIRQQRTDLSALQISRRRGLYSRPTGTATRDEYEDWTERIPPDDEIEDPLAYWTSSAVRRKWPRLARMAIDVLSVVAMSSEPERIFSLAGLMVTKERNRLGSDTIQAVQCLRNWGHHGLLHTVLTPPRPLPSLPPPH